MQCNVLGEEDKIDVLYGAAEPAVDLLVRQHLAACAACREEMAALEGTRQTLSLWTRSEAKHPAKAQGVSSWGSLFGLRLAAAVLLALGAALALRGSELRYEAGRVSFRLGPGDDQPLRRVIEEQEARHQRELAALRASIEAPSSGAPGLSQVQVEGWIRESEARQSQRFLARFEEFKVVSDTQRRLDMARVSAGLSYLDGKNGQHVARTSELMNYMLQTSYKR